MKQKPELSEQRHQLERDLIQTTQLKIVIENAYLTTRIMVTGIRWTGPLRLNAKPTWE